jgi:hypothetical protein
MRKRDQDFDPDELDETDSFYDTTKSLLVLFQISGVMPIMRSPKGEILMKIWQILFSYHWLTLSRTLFNHL